MLGTSKEIKYPGLNILPPGMEQNKFTTEVEKVIYNELDKIS